jgi:hypothetical protein
MLDDQLMQRPLTWEDAQAMAGSALLCLRADECGDAAVPLTLVSVQSRGQALPGKQYSLLFKGPRSPLLSQCTYRMRHEQLGDFAIFITPLSQSADATDYEACFAHL